MILTAMCAKTVSLQETNKGQGYSAIISNDSLTQDGICCIPNMKFKIFLHNQESESGDTINVVCQSL